MGNDLIRQPEVFGISLKTLKRLIALIVVLGWSFAGILANYHFTSIVIWLTFCSTVLAVFGFCLAVFWPAWSRWPDAIKFVIGACGLLFITVGFFLAMIIQIAVWDSAIETTHTAHNNPVPKLIDLGPGPQTGPPPANDGFDKRRLALKPEAITLIHDMLSMRGSSGSLDLIFAEDDPDSSELALNFMRAISLSDWSMVSPTGVPGARLEKGITIIVAIGDNPPKRLHTLEETLSDFDFRFKVVRDFNFDKDAIRLSIGPHSFD